MAKTKDSDVQIPEPGARSPMVIEDSTQPINDKPKAAPQLAAKPVTVVEVNGMKIEDF